ncbi:MAG: DUF4251 domain-containing protein, partial [Bacteroidales bacterium]
GAGASIQENLKQKKHRSEEDKIWIPGALESQQFVVVVQNIFAPRGIVQLKEESPLGLYRDSAFANLPYVGILTSPNLAMADNAGVAFANPYINYKVVPAKKNYSVYFTVKKIGETFDIKLVVDKNGYTTVIVNSSARNSIKYSGILKMLSNSKKTSF